MDSIKQPPGPARPDYKPPRLERLSTTEARRITGKIIAPGQNSAR